MLDGTGLLCFPQNLECGAQYRCLTLAITRCAKGKAEGVLDARHAGHTHGGGEVGDVGKGDGRKAGSLYLSLNQSNGPAANGSHRHQDDHVDPLRL